MDKTLLLKAQLRENTGSKYSVEVRKGGRIPAVIYGHKQEPLAVSLDKHSFVEGLHHGHRLMDIQLGRKQQKTIVKEIQYDYLGKDVIHADLMRVKIGETVKVTIPIELKGTAKGTHQGGIIEEHTDYLEIECQVTAIPESIVVSVKEVDVGDSIQAGDVALGEGIKLITEPSTVLVTCGLVAAAKTTEEIEAEQEAAPEVIGEVKEAEGEKPEEQ
ncbi:MAG: 50S ribosomal protein L25 [Sedimentisphaerales bacterium]|nr:50S ribosomal protein L25 [Sedimentisphaerales bacterium]